MRLVEAVYNYAVKEDMLDILCEMTNSGDTKREVLLPALAAWFFEVHETPFLPLDRLPKQKNKTGKKARYEEFGTRLNAAMNLLDLSNVQLARSINVDDSLVSRWRSGSRSPRNNPRLSQILIEALIKYSKKNNRQSELAKLSGISVSLLDEKKGVEHFTTWLLRNEDTSIRLAMGKLLAAIGDLPDVPPSPASIPEFSYPFSNEKYYQNIAGLRQGVLRFLVNAIEQGGELLLYSDEDMTWLTGSPLFFEQWKLLMGACFQAGVTIRIIHNIDRDKEEMLTAIRSWLPLYMSGHIIPYVCGKQKDNRFAHTFFLRRNETSGECIYGSNIVGTSGKWYDYITDSKRLSIMEEEYEALLSFCEPLVDVCIDDRQCSSSHVMSLLEQAEKETECRLFTLPEPSLSNIQIALRETCVTVFRCEMPYAAFSFTAPSMIRAFQEYIDALF